MVKTFYPLVEMHKGNRKEGLVGGRWAVPNVNLRLAQSESYMLDLGWQCEPLVDRILWGP